MLPLVLCGEKFLFSEDDFALFAKSSSLANVASLVERSHFG